MRISYRTSSIAVLLVFIGMFLVPESLMVRPRAPTKALADGVVYFDPCIVWDQMGGADSAVGSRLACNIPLLVCTRPSKSNRPTTAGYRQPYRVLPRSARSAFAGSTLRSESWNRYLFSLDHGSWYDMCPPYYSAPSSGLIRSKQLFDVLGEHIHLNVQARADLRLAE
jgi:hypothetical protein